MPDEDVRPEADVADGLEDPRYQVEGDIQESESEEEE